MAARDMGSLGALSVTEEYQLYGKSTRAEKIHDFRSDVPRPAFLRMPAEPQFLRSRSSSSGDPESESESEAGQGQGQGQAVTTYWEMHGHGPQRCVFVCGLAGSHAEWEDVVDCAAFDEAKHSFLFLDNRGCGLSSTPPGRWRSSDLAADVLRLLDHVGWTEPSSVHLIGVSMGGMIVQEAALADPQRVASLTLISTHAGGLASAVMPAGAIPVVLRAAAASHEAEIVDAALELKYPRHVLHPPRSEPDGKLRPPEASGDPQSPSGVPAPHRDLAPYHDDSQWHALPARLRLGLVQLRRMRKIGEHEGELEINYAGVAKQALVAATHYVSWRRLEHLRHCGIPTLVVAGHEDIVIDPSHSAMLARELGAELLAVPGAGHCVNEQEAQRFNAAFFAHIDAAQNYNAARRLAGAKARARAPFRPHATPSAVALGLLVAACLAARKTKLLDGTARRIVALAAALLLLRRVSGRLQLR